jgi:hypothetical protein
MNTDLKGEHCEYIAVLRLMKAGYILSRPVNKCRYDLIADDRKGHLLRVQVKTANVKKNYIEFRTASVSKSGHKQYTSDEIDYFAVVEIETENVYIIDVKECSKETQRLRITNPLNNQKKCILFAKDFLLE